MFDIHSHILPGVDDGARTLEESLAIATAQSAGGTHVMFATPHVQSEREILESERIPELTRDLNEKYSDAGIAIKAIPGAELYPAMSIIKGLDKGLPITLGGNGKYVLIDLPHSTLPFDFDTILFEILSRGVIPILAHPERCPHFKKTPEEAEEYLHKGCALQLNAGSFTGRHGEDAKRLAEKYFQQRVAHFLASDAHKVGRNCLGDVAEILATPGNEEYVKFLTATSGLAVLDGRPLPQRPAPLAVEPVKKKSLLDRLSSRLGLA